MLVPAQAWSRFIPAHGTGDETGVLDPDPAADQYLVPDPEPGFSGLPIIYIHEELATRGFYGRWSERANGHLYVSLYDGAQQHGT